MLCLKWKYFRFDIEYSNKCCAFIQISSYQMLTRRKLNLFSLFLLQLSFAGFLVVSTFKFEINIEYGLGQSTRRSFQKLRVLKFLPHELSSQQFYAWIWFQEKMYELKGFGVQLGWRSTLFQCIFQCVLMWVSIQSTYHFNASFCKFWSLIHSLLSIKQMTHLSLFQLDPSLTTIILYWV